MKTFVSILLILSTAALVVLSLVQLGRIDLVDELTTSEVTENGSLAFSTDLRTTTGVTISSREFGEIQFNYDVITGLWNGTSPWKDRADGPKAIEKLILFAINAEVQDSLRAGKKNLRKLGFDKDNIHVTFSNSLNEVIADFDIGKSSAWRKKIEGKEEILLPTVYLRQSGRDENDSIYLTTDTSGDIRSLFEDQAKAFRDHRPFALNIGTLKEARISRSKTEIVLSHQHPAAPWKLVKPLELDTDRNSVMEFLANLSKLEAIKLHELDSVSLPESEEGKLQVSISTFADEENEATLTVYPASDGAGSCYATVSNRNVVFELPLIASAKTSNYITQLPKSVNELRSRSMMKWTKADRADLRSVIIRTAEPLAEPVIVSRIPGEPYQLITPNNTKTEIDEAVFGELLKELASTPVKNFASDAATDFSPYGIDKPMVILDFISFESPPKQLRIGKTSKIDENKEAVDTFFANMRGTPIVWEISSDLVASIPTRYWAWQPKEIWNLPVIDIIQFTAQQKGKDKISVDYDYLSDDFKATVGDQDLTNRLLPQRAKFFLNENHLLTAQKRLSPNSTVASEALKDPAFTATITVQEFDDQGLPSTQTVHTLELAKSSKTGNSAFYYAQSSSQPGYFILSIPSVRKLAALDLFDEE